MARRTILIIFIILFAVVSGVFVIRALGDAPSADQRAAELLAQKKTGQIGSGYFNFDIVDSDEERALGLSGRARLLNSDAMLFVFDTATTKNCIWMKDMKFSLDIMWFDQNKKLIYMKNAVSPDTYPTSFCPEGAAKYVVEVSAGVADRNQLKLGDVLDIEL